jgi:hypothetical protein
MPGAIGQIADDRLHQQAGQGRGNPQQWQGILFGTQRLENPGHEAALQSEPKLDTQKAERHVPYLPERQCRFVAHRSLPGVLRVQVGKVATRFFCSPDGRLARPTQTTTAYVFSAAYAGKLRMLPGPAIIP